MTAAPLDVTVLTGFLGAGKTTLLNRLLASPDLADTLVLINEFGEIGLDHLLVERLDEEMVLLKSGCVCCTIRGDLKQALASFGWRRARGEIPRFERVVLETTGLADPTPIVATLVSDRMLRHHFRVSSVVTVVDALHGADTLARQPVAVRQVAAADAVILSKADLADRRATEHLEERMAILNPAANVHRHDPKAPPPRVIGPADGTAIRRRFTAETVEPDDAIAGIRSLTLTARAPIDWARFAIWLSMLLNRHGASILRSKGLVDVIGSTTPVVVQSVQHLVYPPAHLESWPHEPGTHIVMITSDLDVDAIRRSFAAAVGTV